MAQLPQIVWTKKATKDYISILDYWTARNKSIVYAEKLISIVQHTVQQLQHFPELGKATSRQHYRYVVIDEDYLLIYKFSRNELTIMRIWHSKQNPKRITYLK